MNKIVYNLLIISSCSLIFITAFNIHMTLKFNVAILWFLLFTNEQYFKLNTFAIIFDNMKRYILEKCNIKSNKYFIFYSFVV